MADTWEIWDLAVENTSEKIDSAKFAPILSTKECTINLSGSDSYKHSSDEELRISPVRKTMIDAYISEDSGIVIPNKDDSRYSPTMNIIQRTRSRNSIRSSSLSESDDNIGLTNSYTLEEPGKETKHVLILSGKHRGSSLTNAISTSSLNSNNKDKTINRRFSLDLDQQNLHRSIGRLNSSCDSLHFNESVDRCIRSSSLNCDTTHSRSDATKTKEIVITTTSLESSFNESDDNKNDRQILCKQSKEKLSFLKKAKSIDALNKIFRKNVDGQLKKFKTNKNLSSSTRVISNVYSVSPNNNIQSSTTPTTQKINKSIFTKAKHLFKRPLKKSTSLTEFETSTDISVEALHNKTYPVDSNQRLIDAAFNNQDESELDSGEKGNCLVEDYTTTAMSGEEKHVLIMNKPRGGKPFDKTDCSDNKEIVMFLGKTTNRRTDTSTNNSSFQNLNHIVDVKKESCNYINILSGEYPSSSVLTSGITKIEGAGLVQLQESGCNINEDDYDIIDFFSPERKNSAKTTTTDCSSQTDVKYDIIFKPEIVTDTCHEVNDSRSESGIKPSQDKLMSLVVGLGLGEVGETQNVVTNMNSPHSVEEHGEFRLHGARGEKDDEVSVSVSKEMLESTTHTSSKNKSEIIHDICGDDTDSANSDLESDRVDYSGDDEFVDLSDDSDEQIPLTSTPINSPMKHSKQSVLKSQNDIKNENDKNENGSCNEEEAGKSSKYLDRLGLEEEKLKTKKQQTLSLKKQYGIHDSITEESSLFYESSSENESMTLSMTENNINDVIKQEKEDVNKENDDSSNESSLNKDALINRLSKLELLEKIHSRVYSVEDDIAASARKGSSDSLASFEYHENEMMNSSSSRSPVSPAFPSSPATQRTQPKVFHITYSPSSSLNGNSSGSDSLEDEEPTTNEFQDAIAERRITVELLNYMPPIEEAHESINQELTDSELSTKYNNEKEDEKEITSDSIENENVIKVENKDCSTSFVFDVPIDSEPFVTDPPPIISEKCDNCSASKFNATVEKELRDHINEVIEITDSTDDITTRNSEIFADENPKGEDDIPSNPEQFRYETKNDDLLTSKNRNLHKTDDEDLTFPESKRRDIDIVNPYTAKNADTIEKDFITSDESAAQEDTNHELCSMENELEESTEIVVPKKCLWYDYTKDSTDKRSLDQKIVTDSETIDDPSGIIEVKKKDRLEPAQKLPCETKDTSELCTISKSENRTKCDDTCTQNKETLFRHETGLDSTDGDSGLELIIETCRTNKDLDLYEKRKTSLQKTNNNDEEEDSGTELRYDENHHTTHHNNSEDFSNYEVCLENIKPLLHDAELVAHLFLRLANKYGMHCNAKNDAMHVHHLHSAQIAYDAIQESNLINFSSVISHLLSYMGALKSENPLPDNISIPDLLKFLEKLVEREAMTSYHVTMLACFLSRPNRRLTAFHQSRMNFLQSCFKYEIGQVHAHSDSVEYLSTCFRKISEYFIQWDMQLTQRLTHEFLIPHLNDELALSFMTNVLVYMNLKKDKNSVVTNDIASPLLLLDQILRSTKMTHSATNLLKDVLHSNDAKFRFCSEEKDKLCLTLKQI